MKKCIKCGKEIFILRHYCCDCKYLVRKENAKKYRIIKFKPSDWFIKTKKRREEIKIKYVGGKGISFLAKEYGVSRQRIEQIVSERVIITHDLREKILLRYGNKCFICKSEKKTIQLHHIDFKPKNTFIGNLMPLCRECHIKLHNNKNIAVDKSV